MNSWPLIDNLPRGGAGGGTVPGIATIWNTSNQSPAAFPTWASLAGIVSPRDEDEALVLDIDGNGSLGFARWSASAGAWGLYLAQFVSLTAMHEFSELIRPNCTATIPSGRTYRHISLVGPDAVTVRQWIWAGVSSSVDTFAAYLVGTEADAAARLAHGFSQVVGIGCTITGDVAGSGYTRLASPAGGTQSVQLTTLASAIASDTKIYVKLRIKASTAGSSGSGSIVGMYLADGSRIAYPRQQGASQAFAFHNQSNSILSSGALRSGGATLPASDTWLELVDDGQTVSAAIWRDGVVYHVEKRSSVSSGSNLFGFLVGTISSPGAAFADVRDVSVMTFT